MIYSLKPGACPGIGKGGGGGNICHEFVKYYMIYSLKPGACPGIGKGGGLKSENFFFFFFAFQSFSGGGPAENIAEKMIFSTKKAAKYR